MLNDKMYEKINEMLRTRKDGYVDETRQLLGFIEANYQNQLSPEAIEGFIKDFINRKKPDGSQYSAGHRLKQIRMIDSSLKPSNQMSIPVLLEKLSKSEKSHEKTLLNYTSKISLIRAELVKPIMQEVFAESHNAGTRVLGEGVELTQALMKRLMSEAEPRRAVVAQILYITGMRATELRAVTWEDLSEYDDTYDWVLIFNQKANRTRTLFLPKNLTSRIKEEYPPVKGLPIFYSLDRKEPLTRIQLNNILYYVSLQGIDLRKKLTPKLFRDTALKRFIEIGLKDDMYRYYAGIYSVQETPHFQKKVIKALTTI
jgi:integrase